MLLDPADLQAIWLTVRLASVVTVILLLVGTPVAWWLARTRSWAKDRWGRGGAAAGAAPLGAGVLSAAGHGSQRPGGLADHRPGDWSAAVHLLGAGAGLGLLLTAVYGAAAAERL
jgi:hypothetical protein